MKPVKTPRAQALAEISAAASKARKPRAQVELPYHMAVLNALRLVLPGARIHHSPNELGMGGTSARNLVVKAKRMGMLPGFPDFAVMLTDGRTLYFEVKAPEDKALGRKAGRESADQAELREWAQSVGHLWAVVQGPGDVIDALQRWGVTMRGRVA